MKVGIDTFTLRTLKLDPFQTLDYCREHDLQGAQFGGIRGISPDLDAGQLREIRQHADALGLYSHVSIGTCNPYRVKGSLDDHRAELTRQIEAAASVGWRELHSSLGSQHALGANVPQFRQERLVGQVDLVAEEVQLAAARVRAYLHTGYHRESPVGSADRRLDSVDAVVIGDSDGAQVFAGRRLDDLPGGECPVGRRRVNVQVHGHKRVPGCESRTHPDATYLVAARL